MNEQELEIKIQPIFDQSVNPQIWQDFARLEILCRDKYGYTSDMRSILESHEKEWNTKQYNFAFAAYDSNKMVGFINGYKENRSYMYLHNLYVDPKFHKMKIGTQLLILAQNAASMVAKRMQIISLPDAVNFYEKRLYDNRDGRLLTKKLDGPRTGIVPIFKWYKSFNTHLNVDVDYGLLNQSKNQPIFAYIGPEHKIEAVALNTKDGTDKIWINESKPDIMKDFYQTQLMKQIDRIK